MNTSNLVSYLDSVLGSHFGHHPEFQWGCPFCVDRVGDESQKRKLRINVQKGFAICYRCGFKSAAMDYLFRCMHGGKLLAVEEALLQNEVQGVSTQSIADHLLMKFYASNKPEDESLRPVLTPREMIPLIGNEKDLAARIGWDYLRRTRGLGIETKDVIKRWRVGYCLTGPYANRLVIGVRQGGKQVYFNTRYCGDHLLKSKNPPNQEKCMTKEHCLLGYDFCVGAKKIVICEGWLSCTPFEHAVALMGKTCSQYQMDLLSRLAEAGAEEFVLATDPDASREAFDLSKRMAGRFPNVTYLTLPMGRDPFDERKNIKNFMDERRPIGIGSLLRGLHPKIKRMGC